MPSSVFAASIVRAASTRSSEPFERRMYLSSTGGRPTELSTRISADHEGFACGTDVGGSRADEDMDQPLQPLERDLDALRAAWADAMPAFGALPGGAQVELEQMSDAGLVGVTDLVARVRRDADALLVRVGNEIARRSGPEFGDTGLAKQQGFHNAARLLAATTGGSRSEASRLIAVGAATAERQSFTGEHRPAPHPHVAAALGAATISAEAAAAISSMLDRVGARADPALADVTEAALVDLAVVAPLELVVRGVREAEARLDQDGVEPTRRRAQK